MIDNLRKLSQKVESAKRMRRLLESKDFRVRSEALANEFIIGDKWKRMMEKAAGRGFDYIELSLKLREEEANLIVEFFEELGFMSFIKIKKEFDHIIVVDWKKRETLGA